MDGKEFINNFRNTRLNPFSPTSPPSLITRGDIQKARQADRAKNEAFDRARQRRIQEQVEATAPLREEIKKMSDGKVMVDQSIYDQEELTRILDTVKKMGTYNNGVLFPGYTVISDSEGLDDEYTAGQFQSGDKLNIYGFASFPNGFYGTKNNPYRIYIRDANSTAFNDSLDREDIEQGWHPKTGESVQSATHTHELSHSAHKESLKKSHPPTLWVTQEEDEAYKNLIKKYSSFRDLVEKLTDKLHLENTRNAAASVSGYAESAHDGDAADEKFPFSELFAEAYTDVLYNGDSARPFSKDLIEAYSEYLNEYNSIFGDERSRAKKILNTGNEFVDSLRNSTPLDNRNVFQKKLRLAR